MIEPLIELNQGEGTQTGPVTTPLGGDLSGTVAAATVATVGAKTAAAIATSVTDTVAATAANTVSTIVKRDASGDIAVGKITATAVNGYVERVIASGAGTSVPTATATVLGTLTRQAGETVRFEGFITDNAAATWHLEATMYPTMVKTGGGADEFQAKFTNVSGTNRSLDWKIVGRKAVP